MLLIIISLSLFACTKVQGLQGGDNTRPGEVPWAVSIQQTSNNHPICGGAIINEGFVLTAGHCIARFTNPNVIRVTAGNVRSQPRSIHKVVWMHKHENYKDIGYAIFNDIALLQVKPRFKYNTFVTDVRMPEYNFRVSPGTRALMVGWGVAVTKNKVRKDTKNPDILQKISVKMISEKECRDFYKGRRIDIKEQNVCSISHGITGTCTGDSGGPLMIGRTLIGIASWMHHGPEKCSDSPTVYVNVSHYIDWILENMTN